LGLGIDESLVGVFWSRLDTQDLRCLHQCTQAHRATVLLLPKTRIRSHSTPQQQSELQRDFCLCLRLERAVCSVNEPTSITPSLQKQFSPPPPHCVASHCIAFDPLVQPAAAAKSSQVNCLDSAHHPPAISHHIRCQIEETTPSANWNNSPHKDKFASNPGWRLVFRPPDPISFAQSLQDLLHTFIHLFSPSPPPPRFSTNPRSLSYYLTLHPPPRSLFDDIHRSCSSIPSSSLFHSLPAEQQASLLPLQFRRGAALVSGSRRELTLSRH
jgi:hypothetical protein